MTNLVNNTYRHKDTEVWQILLGGGVKKNIWGQAYCVELLHVLNLSMVRAEILLVILRTMTLNWI